MELHIPSLKIHLFVQYGVYNVVSQKQQRSYFYFGGNSRLAMRKTPSVHRSTLEVESCMNILLHVHVVVPRRTNARRYFVQS